MKPFTDIVTVWLKMALLIDYEDIDYEDLVVEGLINWLFRAENIPGYTPSQLLEKRSNEELRRLLCQRCYLIKEYDIALKGREEKP